MEQTGSGISQSISGYLPKGKEYSKSISLYDEDKNYLREERIVYLHTAFLKECSIKESTNIYFKVVPSEDDVSLLDIIEEITNLFGILSCGIQIYVKSKGLKNHETKVKGRVLRHLPKRPFEILQDATDIGLEQLFKLTKYSGQNIIALL